MPSDKPIIGITLSEAEESVGARWPVRKAFCYLKREYYEAVWRSGAVPVLLPRATAQSAMLALVGSMDGLLLTGGGDLHPAEYGKKPHRTVSDCMPGRDSFELQITTMAIDRGIPVLGICRGHQVLNVALGGTLFQDLCCTGRKTIPHADPAQTGTVFHRVTISEGTKLRRIIGSATIMTNSSHHQVVDKVGKSLVAAAFSPDGLNEAVEHTESDFVLGVQWHPEGIFEKLHSRRLFKAFVEAARKRTKEN